LPEQAPTTPQRLSTPDFHARVHALNPRVAVFDCDGTLWSGDAGSSFMHWTIDTKLISPEQISWINERYEGYTNHTVSEYDICGDMARVYNGLSIETLRRAAAEFFRDYVAPNIFSEMSDLIAELQRNRCDIWAVSSTNNWVIEEGVRRFNIPPNRVLAARVEIENDLITDRLLHVPTDQDKVVALHNVNITAPDAVFGNSVHDAAMLSITKNKLGAFPVNPSIGLLERSAIEAWPVYFPSSVTP
jgi:phosphoserine phosphatase